VPEICAVTGHSHAEANEILQTHHLHRDPQLAWNAIRKLEVNLDGRADAGNNAKPQRATLFYRGERRKLNKINWLGRLDSNQD